MGNSRSKHDTGNVYNVNIRQRHRSKFAKLWNYVLSEKKLRARLFVMNNKNVCDDDFIEHLKDAFVRSLVIGIVSNDECDMPLDTKILIEMADILRFADFDPEHKDAKIVRAIPELHERIQELGVKVASLETTYHLLPEYRSLFLTKNVLEYLVVGASGSKHLILRIIDELLRDLHPEDHDLVLNLSSRLCYHLLAQRDAGSAHVVIHCLTRVVGLVSGSQHHLKDVLEEPMAKSIIGVAREIDVENDASFVSVAVDFMLHVTRLYPPVIDDWLKNDVKSCLRKLLTGVEPQETDEMKLILKDRILVNKIMKFVSVLIPPLPNEKKFELLNDYDNNNQHVLVPKELLKNRLIQEFMATMFTVVLHVAQVDRCNRDHLLTVLKMICHLVNHAEMFEEHLLDIVKHISASIHSDDIIIRSTSLSIATEITNRDSKMAVRYFFRHGFIEGVLKLVDETKGPMNALPMSREFHHVETQSSILMTLILKRRDEAFSSPYRELGSVRDLLNESMSDRALEMFKGVLTNHTILRADLASSDILSTLVAYFLPRCTCLSGFEHPEEDNCMNCRYKRLKNFAKIFLEIKDDYSLPPLKDLNLLAFASLVKILNISASRINTDGSYPKDIGYFVPDFKPAFHPNKVDPRLGKCVLIDSALGPTLCEKNLKRRFSGQVIRLLTICHALNRSLGVLFEVMNYPPLLSSNAFLNWRMQGQAKHFLRENRGKNSIEIPMWFIKNVTKCPFMVTLNTRKNLFDAYLRSLDDNNDNQSDASRFEVDRGNSAEQRGLLDRVDKDDGTWYVNFKDEVVMNTFNPHVDSSPHPRSSSRPPRTQSSSG